MRRLDSAREGRGLTRVGGEELVMGLSWTRRFRDERVRFERLCSTTSVKPEPPWAESSLRTPGALKSVLTTQMDLVDNRRGIGKRDRGQ